MLLKHIVNEWMELIVKVKASINITLAFIQILVVAISFLIESKSAFRMLQSSIKKYTLDGVWKTCDRILLDVCLKKTNLRILHKQYQSPGQELRLSNEAHLFNENTLKITRKCAVCDPQKSIFYM